MSDHPLDHPALLSMLLFPRAEQPGSSRLPNIRDGTIPVGAGVMLGYRLYVAQEKPARYVVLYFHGNGEVASDYDPIAPEFFRVGAALLVVDYRGYGWSSGTALLSTLLDDAEAVMPALPVILKAEGLDQLPLFVMGRSLGSAPAVHLAHRFPNAFKGLVIESGFAQTLSRFEDLRRALGLPEGLELPFQNARKMQEIYLPLLVIHGERDMLLPLTDGQQLYEASPSAQRVFERIPRAGHNDLLFYGIDQYFGALGQFLRRSAE